MRYIKIIALLLIVNIMAGINCQAQTDSNVYNERVVVTSRYKPVVEESTKINVAPSITDTVSTITKSFTYDITTRRLTSLYEPSRIKAARIIGEPATRLYNNYLKLGMGNYWSPLAELYFNSLRNPNKTYGISATHRSSWGRIGRPCDSVPSPTHYGQAPFSLTDINLFGKLITNNNLQLSANVGYENDFNRYYGFTDSTLFAVRGIDRDSLKRLNEDYKAVYNLASLNVGVKTLNTDVNALGYEANLNVQDLFASYSQNELNINVDGNIHYGFTLAQKYKGVAYLHLTYQGFLQNFNPITLPYGFDAALDAALLNRDDSTGRSVLASSSFKNLYKANPYLDFIFNGLQIHAGGVVAVDAFNVPSGKVHIYPDASVSKSFFNQLLMATLAAEGNIDANSWNVIRQVNPYVAPNALALATSHYDFSARVRLNISKKMDLNVYGTYSMLNDDLSFRLDDSYELHNVFTPVYDSLTRLKVGGNFVFVNDEMLRLEVKGNYYLYKNKKTALVGPTQETVELPLYYRPSFDAGISATINYHDKVFGRIEFQALGRSPYATATAADGTDSLLYLPMRYGVNLEVEYRHNKALSFFLKADNLCFQRYFYWQNYPSYRALFLLGLTYTIPY